MSVFVDQAGCVDRGKGRNGRFRGQVRRGVGRVHGRCVSPVRCYRMDGGVRYGWSVDGGLRWDGMGVVAV